MDDLADFPVRGVVFWPVGTGDSSTVVVNDQLVLQVDLHDLAKAQSEENPEVAVVDRLVEALPLLNGKPYLAVFALTHADKDHCLGFADLLNRVHIGEIWSTPRLWREYEDNPDGEALCPDAVAFKEESERRINAIKKAIENNTAPTSGDRIKVIGYDDHHSAHAYDELPEEYLAWPGHSITVLDGTDASDHFEAFIHAPFKEDAAAARNETSLAMQVTLADETGIAGKVLLFGDLAHDTIMKIFNYSEYKKRTEYLEWDLLLAPHHCSKRVMYKKDAEGREELQVDVMNAFERHARAGAVIVSSSNAVPDVDTDGANPPHRMAWNRYVETVESADHAICTMTLLDDEAPAPVIFGVDADGARIVTQHLETKSLVEAALSHSGASPSRRLVAVAAAAASVAAALSSAGTTTEVPKSGPERIDEAITADRGGQQAPQTAVGFGR